MVTVRNMPTDRYGRYSVLKQELIKATGLADKSDDNAQMLLSILDLVAQEYGYNVVKKVAKRAKSK